MDAPCTLIQNSGSELNHTWYYATPGKGGPAVIVGDSVSCLKYCILLLQNQDTLSPLQIKMTKVINKMNDFQFETSFTFQIKIQSLSKEDSLSQQT